jgi:serine/threonine protein kinase
MSEGDMSYFFIIEDLNFINKVEDEEYKSFLCEYRMRKVLIFRYNVKENAKKFASVFVKDALAICKLKENPFILKCIGLSLTKDYFYLMFENFENSKDLKAVLSDESIKIPLMKKINMISQVSHGVNFLNAFKISHNDLRASSILVTEDLFKLEIKLINYGMVDFTSALGRKIKLTNIAYIDPELLVNSKYERTTDIYSFGTLMWEIFTRDSPFKNGKLNALKTSIVNQGNRPDITRIPKETPDELVELIKRCWGESKSRPNIGEIINILDNEFNIE